MPDLTIYVSGADVIKIKSFLAEDLKVWQNSTLPRPKTPPFQQNQLLKPIWSDRALKDINSDKVSASNSKITSKNAPKTATNLLDLSRPHTKNLCCLSGVLLPLCSLSGVSLLSLWCIAASLQPLWCLFAASLVSSSGLPRLEAYNSTWRWQSLDA